MGLKASKTVTFSQDVRIKRTLHKNNYTDEEFQSCWFNDTELRRCQNEMRVVVAMVEQGFEIDEDKYCLQGLEFQTERGAALRMRSKLESMNAVLDEQDWQTTEGVFDPEKLAMVYQQVTYK
jgi:hypothetical protein